MGKLFGTDGIRGVANETLDARLAYRIGQAAAIAGRFGHEADRRHRQGHAHFVRHARRRADRGYLTASAAT